MKLTLAVALCLGGAATYLVAYHLWWPLVFFALSPVAVAFRGVARDREAVFLALLAGWPAMFFVQYPLWVFRVSAVGVLAAYQALTWIPIALAVRGGWRRWRVPLTFSWPIAWTAAECLRLAGPLGTPFGALFAPCAEMTRMLQIGALGGMHLASVPIAMVQGWAADVLLACFSRRRAEREKRVRFTPAFGAATVAVMVVWCGVLVYGTIQLHRIEGMMHPGPRIAVIQPDIPHLTDAVRDYDPVLLREKLQRLSEEAVAQGGPVDLVVWPEGIADFPLRNRGFLEAGYDPRMDRPFGLEGLEPVDAVSQWMAMRESALMEEARFADWVRRLGVPVLVGMVAHEPAPPGHDEPFLRYNAAVRFDPEQGQVEPYQAKVRLYPAGESAPWRGSWLEAILGRPDNELTPGRERHVYRTEPEGLAYVIRICSELKFPRMAGPLVDGSDYDFLISPANEGMFRRNRAQVALRDCAVYRAIERRVGVVRASNSGVSGFVAPSGRSYGQVANARGRTRAGLGVPEAKRIEELVAFRRQHEAEFPDDEALRAELERRIAEVETVRAHAAVEGWSVEPVQLADIRTPYERLGDWLPPLLYVATAAMILAAWSLFSRNPARYGQSH